MHNEFVLLAELFYPIIVTQMAGEISEAKASELLGMNIERYREVKADIVEGVLAMLDKLPSPLTLLLESTKDRPG